MLQTSFDFEAAQQAKETGMAAAADSARARAPLELAKEIAIELATLNGETNADAVGELLLSRHGIESLGPAAGSVFRGGGWMFTGRRVVSSRVTNHGRELKVWKLKAEDGHKQTDDGAETSFD